ncbi:hypothetical protein [Allomuricauda sp. SCSIO 65647]|uniref:hypothetical protein n=1 Tax=Allomuricauda sp. SCSIO 65647 TaxID=2908843 RepID=UPI001F168436|nr:hypothetical protein [Muricauda sp. SCSIO 65647]UJH68838.1 hypothetical protein L0P89_06380 [Muricauda sp. SCSIO 65647]
MKNIAFLFVLFLFSGCKQGEKKEPDGSQMENKASNEKPFVRTQNYAVVFNWATQDEKLVMENTVPQSDQLLALWKDSTVENVYYDAKAQYDKFSYFPNITFTLKAEDKTAAKAILNDLVMVKKGIATYTIHPVGTLWLKRDAKKIEQRGLTSSYVAVWNTNKKPDMDITKKQNDAVLELYNEGAIENVYFDIEGTQKQNQKTDFVFFVNADSEEGAKAIIDDLPFVKEQIASYQLYPVGIFWMGLNEE